MQDPNLIQTLETKVCMALSRLIGGADSFPQFLALSADFSSDQPGHRLKIREHIYQYQTHLFHREEHAELLILEKVPQLAQGGISITHCQGVGGYVIAPRALGLDIELAHRLNSTLVQRIATAEEISVAPFERWLWPAKEAVFKAMRPPPKVMSEIRVTAWVRIESSSPTEQSYFFSCCRALSPAQTSLEKILGLGVCGSCGPYVWALFLCE